jgi:hypothetical protein
MFCLTVSTDHNIGGGAIGRSRGRHKLGCGDGPTDRPHRAEEELHHQGSDMKKHRWITAVIYELSEEEARRAATGQVVNLQHRHRIGVDGPGCLNCERPYEEVRGVPCESPEAEEGS